MHTSSFLVLLTLFISLSMKYMLGMAGALQPDRTVNANKTAIIVYARVRGYCNESMNEEVDDAYRPSLFRYDSALKEFSTPCKNMYRVIRYTWSYKYNCNSTNNPLGITYEEMCIYPLPETPDIPTIDDGADDQPQGISNNTEAAHDTDQIVTIQNSTVEVEAKPDHEITTTTHEVTIDTKSEKSPPRGDDSTENDNPVQESGPPNLPAIIGFVCLVIFVIFVIFCLGVLIVFAVKKNREKRSRPNSVLQLDSEAREQIDRSLLNNYAVETTT